MAKKLLYFLSLLIIVSTIIFLISLSYYKKEVNSADSSKSNYEVARENLDTFQKKEETNRVLINEVKKDPNKVAYDAKDTASKVVKILQDSEARSDSEKHKIYALKLSNDVTTEIIENADLASVVIPNDYNLEVATSRGHSIEVLVSSKKSRYLKMNYNTSSKKIDHITEYIAQ